MKKALSMKEEAELLKVLHRNEDVHESEWKPLVYRPRSTVQPRQHVYRVRLDEEEMAGLQTLANAEKMAASDIVRSLIRNAVRTRLSTR
jgi:hypothetical protein